MHFYEINFNKTHQTNQILPKYTQTVLIKVFVIIIILEYRNELYAPYIFK